MAARRVRKRAGSSGGNARLSVPIAGSNFRMYVGPTTKGLRSRSHRSRFRRRVDVWIVSWRVIPGSSRGARHQRWGPEALVAGFCMNCGGSRDTSRWERAEPADAEDLGGARTSRLHRKGTCVPVELWRGGLCGLGSFRNGRRGDRGEVVPVDFEWNDGSVPEKLGTLGTFGVSGHFATGQKAKAPSEDRKGPAASAALMGGTIERPNGV